MKSAFDSVQVPQQSATCRDNVKTDNQGGRTSLTKKTVPENDKMTKQNKCDTLKTRYRYRLRRHKFSNVLNDSFKFQ